jgi:hypothetical protein
LGCAGLRWMASSLYGASLSGEGTLCRLQTLSGGGDRLPCWGGTLSVLFAFVGENNWAHVPLDAARYALLVVGVAGLYLYLRQSGRFGRLGVVGFYVCIFVFALVAVLDLGIIVNEGVEQTYIALGPVRGPLLLLGLLLFGAAVLRAGRLPRGYSSLPRSPMW